MRILSTAFVANTNVSVFTKELTENLERIDKRYGDKPTDIVVQHETELLDTEKQIILFSALVIVKGEFN